MISLHHGSMLDVLKTLPENSVDSCCTDPPYHLTSVVKRFGGANAAPAQFGTDGAFARASVGFMQKSWDGGDIAFRPETWAEVYRVLKPGAFVAAFGASRGYHRMACAIEDAGFEIRDSLMWVYGTGFPKSHDVSKGIDKAAGAEREVIGERARPDGSTRRRDIGGATGTALQGSADGSLNTNGAMALETRPATDAAREWEGWGTALKPAFEPIVLARKPLSEGTVAANVLRWRTGALNIDACRVPGESTKRTNTAEMGYHGGNLADEYQTGSDAGRWPANVVLTYPEETYTVKADLNNSDRAELETWLAKNAEH